LKQAREELGRRLVGRVYGEDGAPSKFWMVFAKRRFMNKQL
jgi:actin related protein 2/3 complex subunit 3